MSANLSFCALSNTLNFPYNPVFNRKPILHFFFPKAKIIASSRLDHRDGIEPKKQETNHSNSAIKAPTAPWMKGPLLVEPNQVLRFSKPRRRRKDSTFIENETPDKALTSKVSGGRGKKAMNKIFHRIEKLQETVDLEEESWDTEEKEKFKFTPGALWGDKDSDLEEIGEGLKFGKGIRRMPWQREEEGIVIKRMNTEKAMTPAEAILDREFLERLRDKAARMRKWVKVKKAGVTQDVVNQIRLIWRTDELAMLKFDVPLCRNMARAREIVEMKTGGLVVWSKEDALVVYRGHNYQLGFNASPKKHRNLVDDGQSSLLSGGGEEESVSIDGSLYEREADRLLDGLGPRFVDWWYPKPLPVDADLLPEVVPGFRPPLRRCPPDVRSQLTDHELTYLRKLARPLPTHFVLGRNRKLQGLAEAVLKLWEKCHIAKIALKWGVPNTDNEQMASELKRLTGGIILLRNKFLIILYRGKDFLPSQVATLVAEREALLMRHQFHEESARLETTDIFSATYETSVNSDILGTLSEFQLFTDYAKQEVRNDEVKIQMETQKARLEKELRDQEWKLFMLKKKIETSVKVLEKLDSAWEPSKQDEDKEIITEEEKECLRSIGLKMDGSLVLGRRGVYGGVIEGLHQHWKHREVAKVITMQKTFSQVLQTAQFLEVESDKNNVLTSTRLSEVVAGRVVSTSRAHISVSSIMFISHPMSHIQLSESLKSEEENGNIPKLAVHMTEKEAVKWSGCVYLIWKVVLELKYDFRKAKILKLRIVRNCRKVVLELKPDFRKATILNSRVGELKKHEACLTARLLFGLVFYDALKPKLIVAEWPPYLIDEEVPLTQKQTNSVEFVPPEPHRPPDLTHSLHISSFALHCTGKPLAMELLTTSSENPEAFPKSSNPPSPTVAEISFPHVIFTNKSVKGEIPSPNPFKLEFPSLQLKMPGTEPKFTWPVPLQAKPRSPPSLQYLKMIQLGSSDSSPLQLKMLGVGNEPNPSRVVELQANWPSFLAILAVWAWLLMLKILYCTDWIEISGKSLRQFNSKPGWPQNAGRFPPQKG
nr:chloroplastic group IIA intron splicing facilitator CRS1, chloroplastic isoform X1 [Ipomoea batatas]